MITDKVWKEVICYRVEQAKTNAIQVNFRFMNGDVARVKNVLKETGKIVLDRQDDKGWLFLSPNSFPDISTINGILQYFEIQTNLNHINWK